MWAIEELIQLGRIDELRELLEIAEEYAAVESDLSEYSRLAHKLIMHTPPKNLVLHEQLVEPSHPLPAKIRAHNA